MNSKRERLVVVWAWGLLLGLGIFACSRQIGSGVLASDSDGTKTLLFTGSSSIRMWKTVGADFPEFQTINTGFGGSQFSDLLRLQDSVIFKYTPDVVFVYEGDNDIALGKKADWVESDAKEVIASIRTRLPNALLVLIAPKPSPSRWHLRAEYIETHQRLEALADQDDQVFFANVWPLMLDERQKVRGDLFTSDSLHMNAEGYRIWKDHLRAVLKEECGY
ncbi:MAG: Uncharacterised protein [Flavobacteriia bacterium]|nr:MAG: Uncharacterised protein [Flavobacteriia bacterium]